MESKNIALVTGGSGFIGCNLVKRLVKYGYEVNLIVRPNSDISGLNGFKGKVKFYHGDICDADFLKRVVLNIKPDRVYHLAASIKRDRDLKVIDELMKSNFIGTLNLLDAVKNASLESFVFASTSDVYGDGEPPFKESQAINPLNPYALSKAAAEMVCKLYFKTFGVPIVVLRMTIVYGPHQKPELLIPELIIKAIKNQDFKMTGGEQERDVIFIDDVIDAFIKASSNKKAIGETINIGSGKKYKIIDIVKTILDMMGNPIIPQIGALEYRKNEIWKLYCNNKKARDLIGWKPVTSLQEGIKKTVDWYFDAFNNQQL